MPPTADRVRAVLALLLVSTTFTGILLSWAWVFRRLWGRKSLLPRVTPRVVPWLEGSIVLVILAYVLLNISTVLIYRGALGLRHQRPTALDRMLMISVLNGLVLVVVPLLLRATSRARWEDFGLLRNPLGKDVLTGVVACLTTRPLVYLTYFLAGKFFKPETHALASMLGELTTPGTIVLAFVSAVILAPLAEELLYRAVLQGWLTELFGRSQRDDPTPVLPSIGPPRRGASVYPIVLTSLLFAAFHADQMPAPVPIFFFSLVLGILYQRTGSLVPSITCHALFNNWSTLALLLAPKPPS